MRTASSLSNRLKEVLTEGTWVTGSNFKAEISNLEWELAVQKYADLNAIAAITFHVHYYIAGVAEVLEGGELTIRDKFSFNAPEIKSDKEWQSRIDVFVKDSERFISLVEKLSEEELNAPFVDPKYGSLGRNIDVLIEHTYYHLGQVVLIKKLLKEQD